MNLNCRGGFRRKDIFFAIAAIAEKKALKKQTGVNGRLKRQKNMKKFKELLLDMGYEPYPNWTPFAIWTAFWFLFLVGLSSCIDRSIDKKEKWKFKPRQECVRLLIDIPNKERYERLKWAYEKTGRCPL